MKKYLLILVVFLTTITTSIYSMNPKYKGSNSSSRAKGNITPQKPTHLFYTPTLEVNDALGMVISPREISFGLGADFMVYLSPWNGRIPDGGNWASIGNARAGAKYRLSDQFTFAGGVDFGDNYSGLGFSGVYNISKSDRDEVNIVPKARLNIKNMSHQIGINLGVLKGMNELFSVMAEPGFRMEFVPLDDPDTTLTFGFAEINAGIRIVPPSLPLLYLDLGGTFDFNIWGNAENNGNFYIDFGFCFKP